ncbi:MAG: hypothetical protein LUG51_11840 [Tannerellaceae bacterium]|nr:hypothetical protein [Tannerellaceae bacterium]
MKKVWILSLLFSFALGFSACNDDDDDAPAGGARVEVTVKDYDGDEQEGVTVYMYIDEPDKSRYTKENADKKAVTDDDGKAVFILDSRDLDLYDTDTHLYFAVFYRVGGDDEIEGTTAITIQRDDNKKVELKVPF